MAFMCSRGWFLLSWGLGAAVLLAAAGASAQTVEEARNLYLEAEFQEAVGAFEAVLGSAELQHADAIEALRFLAALKQMLGDTDAARRHAAAAAALDPAVEAPEGAPPEVEEMLREAAGGGHAPAGVRISAAGELEPGQSARVVARVGPVVPEGLVSSVRMRCRASGGGNEGPTFERDAPPPEVSVDVELGEEDSGLDCEAGAFSPAGALLLRATESLPVGTGLLDPDDGSGDEDSGAVWPWIAAGAGAAVVAGVIIVIVAASGGSDQASFGPTRVEGW